MGRLLQTLAVGLPLLAAGSRAPAQDGQADPVELLRQADAALIALKSFTCTVQSEGVGAMATLAPNAEGGLQARRYAGEDTAGWVFGIHGRSSSPGETEPAEFHVAFDGTAARSLDDRAKVLSEAGADGVEAMLKPGAEHLLRWMTLWSDVVAVGLADESGESIEAFYEGRAVVGGIACDVVRQDTSSVSDIDEYVLWWFLGAEDHLPRRLDLFYLEVGDSSNGIVSVTITDLNPGADVPDSALAITAPEGYEVRKLAGDTPRARRAAPSNLVGKPAPEWALKDADGLEHKLADYRGKVVVIDFWATWCGWCKLAMPGLQKLHEKYAGRDVAVVGIACWETGNPGAYMKENGFTYGLLLNGDDVAPAYGVQGIPRLIVVGPDGAVIHDVTGYDENVEANLSAVIDKALEAK
jgi:thiol-disulfide isomerase/thioredoxin